MFFKVKTPTDCSVFKGRNSGHHAGNRRRCGGRKNGSYDIQTKFRKQSAAIVEFFEQIISQPIQNQKNNILIFFQFGDIELFQRRKFGGNIETFQKRRG